MNLRSPLLIACGLSLMATVATPSWSFNCEGRKVFSQGGYGCYCRNGSPAQTTDLVNFYCPQDRRPSRAAPPPSTIPKDRSAKNARKAIQDEAKAEKRLAEAEKAERRTRRMLNDAKETKALAEKTLSDANKRADALQRKADATDDPAKKIGLLKEQLAIKKSMLPVVRGRDQMGRSISNYENKLRTAERTTARARAGLAQARQARIAAVTGRSPSSSFRSQSSTAKPVPNPEREAADIKKDIANAKSSTQRTVNNARDKWRESQRKTLDLAAKWGQAVKDGDTAKATALFGDLQKAQATNKRYEAQFRKVEASSADTASLPGKASTAQQKISALEENKQATPRATPAPQAKSKASPATSTTPKYSLTGKQQPGLQTKVEEEPNQVPTTKFTWVNGILKPDWKSATIAQREEYLAKVKRQLQEGQQKSERLDRNVRNYDRAITGTQIAKDAIQGCAVGAVVSASGPLGCAGGAVLGPVEGWGWNQIKKAAGKEHETAVNGAQIGYNYIKGPIDGAATAVDIGAEKATEWILKSFDW